MDEMIDLNRDTALIYAVKAYDKPIYIRSEIKEDLKHFSYVRRLFRRYSQYGELRERLILNHIVILYNIFGVPAATRLLFYHTRPDDYAVLKTFLVFLNYMPDRVYGIKGLTIVSTDLQLDPMIVTVLRNIKNP
jgi:hypothetical protein